MESLIDVLAIYAAENLIPRFREETARSEERRVGKECM